MSKTILIVDDSASIRHAVNVTLQSANYSTVIAVDGQDAIDMLDGKVIDLVITDLNMPNVDGIQLISKIRNLENYKFVPILMLTTESQMDKKMKAKEAGATGWIVKPFVPEKLIAVTRKVLR